MAANLSLTGRLCSVSLAVLLLAPIAPGQTAPTDATLPQTVEDALYQMYDQAGVIFTGQVVAVRPLATANAVEIEFHVDTAVRGCTAGAPYILREWAGLWSGGSARYRPGQRLLMFLYAPSASGLTSPVGGMVGAIPVHGASSPLLATGSSVSPYSVADLRWVATQLLHPVSYRAAPVHSSQRSREPLPSAVTATAEGVVDRDLSAASVTASTNPSAASVPSQQASVEAIVAMLRPRQRAQHDVR